jgi:hypothetical protein
MELNESNYKDPEALKAFWNDKTPYTTQEKRQLIIYLNKTLLLTEEHIKKDKGTIKKETIETLKKEITKLKLEIKEDIKNNIKAYLKEKNK